MTFVLTGKHASRGSRSAAWVATFARRTKNHPRPGLAPDQRSILRSVTATPMFAALHSVLAHVSNFVLLSPRWFIVIQETPMRRMLLLLGLLLLAAAGPAPDELPDSATSSEAWIWQQVQAGNDADFNQRC